ncbi:MAG: glycosyltransferase family 2 protein [Patescibacteria group bacterium]|nr:glycosyltransferase family 2 protein [Patescibacteria group bacterium]
MVNLSVIIPSFNTKEILKKSLLKLKKNLKNYPYFKTEIIVVDNHSLDGSQDFLKKYSGIKLIVNKENLGFAKAINQGIKKAQGQYLLFLNSDVLVKRINFPDLVFFLEKYPSIAGLTVKIVLEDGKLDLACHRGFPTLWRSFCYFSGLEKLFWSIPLFNKIFGGYHLVNKDFDTLHEIDSPSGAFYLVKKSIIDEVGGFDEDFFMYGEDLDLSFRIKKAGYKIFYYPLYEVLHLKYQSGLKNEDEKLKKQTKKHFYQAMKIFYKKHYAKNQCSFVNKIVYWLIDWEKRCL